MTPRHILLRHPHMETLRDAFAAELNTMPDPELCALEPFMAFCAGHRIVNPQAADLNAYSELYDIESQSLRDLALAFERLGLGDGICKCAIKASVARQHKVTLQGIPKRTNRRYVRSVSVPVTELPCDWQKTLRRLRLERTYAASILDRMERRLGMFAWSAQQAGRPIDLTDTAALKGLYDTMRMRSALKNDGTPRWSYLRSTWEELRRFARAHGLPKEVWDKLTKTYENSDRLEGRQQALKIAKAREAGSLPELLIKAEKMLDAARDAKHPQMRHALRNRATAIALGCAIPARPQDVLVHHILGKGIVFEPARGAYRITYTPQKTRTTMGATIDIPLLPDWNKFIDAVILQDQDPRYLGQLRANAIANQRPLYIHYDGTPAVYSWYSRMWETVAKTGGQIARTLVYDEAVFSGEAGIQYGRCVNGHAPNSPVVAKYRSERATKALVTQGQDIMAAGYGADEDISDLL
ncbi:hypothetical protein LCGC14_0841010 [marine sediment metagenome]|uniref:Uncharacterized protein n=3 Tax=root TaxID=1 RepID=A0A7V1BDB9_9RHOB|nr:hypothetical protein [Sulfitobacter litoralis]